jgi:hypothetical protein
MTGTSTVRTLLNINRKKSEGITVCLCLFVFDTTAPVGQGLLIHEFSRSHITTHHSR